MKKTKIKDEMPLTAEQIKARREARQAKRADRLTKQGYTGPMPGTKEFFEARLRGEKPLQDWRKSPERISALAEKMVTMRAERQTRRDAKKAEKMKANAEAFLARKAEREAARAAKKAKKEPKT